MIPFDFAFYTPGTVEEATSTFKYLTEQGKTVIYYAGGTEIINRAKLNLLQFDAAIDIKGIPECNILEYRSDKLIIGAAVTLAQLSKTCLFPFLSAVCQRSADQNSREKITLGGNICGKTPYRETVFPLLLANCEIMIANDQGNRYVPLSDAYHSELELRPGEFLVQAIVERSNIELPWANLNRVKSEQGNGNKVINAVNL